MTTERIEWANNMVPPPWRGQGEVVAVSAMDDRALLAPAKGARLGGLSSAAKAVLKTGTLGTFAVEAEVAAAVFEASCRAGRPDDTARLVTGLVDRWVSSKGTAFAVAVLAALEPDKMVGNVAVLVPPLASRLRAHLAHAKDYDAALKRAKALFEAFPFDSPRASWQWFVPLPETLSFLFPDYRPFFAPALAYNLRIGHTHALLLGAVSSLDELEAVWPRVNNNTWSLNIAGKLGLSGLAPLAQYPYSSAGLVRGLSVYVGPKAAKAMVKHLADKDCRPLVEAYFVRHPELAPAAFKSLGQEAPAIRNAAAAILKRLKLSSPKARPSAAQARSGEGAYWGHVGASGSGLPLVLIDGTQLPRWGGGADGREKTALLKALARARQAEWVSFSVFRVPIFRTPNGLMLVEYFPKRELDGDDEAVLGELGRRMLTAKVRRSKRVGVIELTSGVLGLLADHTSAQHLLPQTIRAVRKQARPQFLDEVVLAPLPPARYVLFEETLDVEDELGLVELRLVVRQDR